MNNAPNAEEGLAMTQPGQVRVTSMSAMEDKAKILGIGEDFYRTPQPAQNFPDCRGAVCRRGYNCRLTGNAKFKRGGHFGHEMLEGGDDIPKNGGQRASSKHTNVINVDGVVKSREGRNVPRHFRTKINSDKRNGKKASWQNATSGTDEVREIPSILQTPRGHVLTNSN